MKKIFPVLLFIILFNRIGISQDSLSTFKFDFIPAGLNFMPLKAGVDEARMGLLYYTANSNMKADIGNSVDFLGFNFPSAKSRITVGAEFMAYAYVTSYLAYRLQIDAIDGIFGGNATYSKECENGRFVARFRYIHNSAHMVDGHWDVANQQWINNKNPNAYGNNYAEVVLARENTLCGNFIRYYAGAAFSTGMKTGSEQLRKNLYKAGFEYAIPNLAGKIFDKDENIFVAVNIDLRGIPEYVGNQNYMLGLKFGNWQGKGISLYASYYNGGDVFNQYLNIRVSRFGIGFMLDFI
ncbi:MAG: hypothetical protein P4L45_09145 [Ignavibacteriaceae bacterium]|nr:hypothetical protein [Ignavibacteriaceae bacterium]